MSTIGPTLPPHLQTKRKRPEHQATDEIHVVRSTSPVSDCGEKRRRVVGPSLPPATLDERPSHLPAEVDRDLAPEQIADDSDSDDGFGPALPSAAGTANAIAEAHRQKAVEEDIRRLEAQRKPQREEWMLVPPKQDDWSARVDPTKLKNRKFNTGKGAKAPTHNGGDNALWTETPEDKRRRLEDEVMGVKAPGQSDVDNKKTAKSAAEIQKIERRIREYNVKFKTINLLDVGQAG